MITESAAKVRFKSGRFCTSIGVTTGITGNYIVVAGRLGENDDAFKFKSITATSVVPVPGTLALLGLGLFGLAAVRRRSKPA